MDCDEVKFRFQCDLVANNFASRSSEESILWGLLKVKTVLHSSKDYLKECKNVF
jgi:hypothetical protein